MRTTVLEKLEGRRLVSYDPENHDLLSRGGEVEVDLVGMDEGALEMVFDFRMEVRGQSDDEIWGFIEGKGRTTIQDEEIDPEDAMSGEKFVLPEKVRALIQGAFNDDLLMPASEAAKAMHLPIPMHGPFDLRGMFAPAEGGDGDQGDAAVEVAEE